MDSTPRIPIPQPAIAEFCRTWRITELALFGSVLRDDFGPESDVDVLVTFEPSAPWSYWEWPEMIEQLEAIVGRPVHMTEEAMLRNPFRRRKILSTRQIVHAA